MLKTCMMSFIRVVLVGGASHLAGVFMTTIKNLPDGTFDLVQLEQDIRGEDIHEPITMMIAVENTHNECGGKVNVFYLGFTCILKKLDHILITLY